MPSTDRASVNFNTLLAVIALTLCVGGSAVWNYRQEHGKALDLARQEARDNIAKDLSFRRWATAHGGVYVPVDATTPPNPYLDVPDRDVVTTSGKRLTLMNPAYMVRQLHEQQGQSFGVKAHLTSLKLLNPRNAPDAWEVDALRQFDDGAEEVADIVPIGGAPFMRVMQAIRVEQGCLKCHCVMGYQVGDVRGGLSASVPLAPYTARESEMEQILFISHGSLWLLGLSAVGLFRRRALWRLDERERVEARILQLNETLEQRVRARTAELEQANKDLESFSYSVSHDLRAPLRALNGYARIIEEDEGERLSPAGKEMLARIWANADRMGALIDDMLQFSRVGRDELRRETIDMTALARAVAEELQADHPGAQVNVAELPPAEGDAAMMRQVWANLIGNGLKFSSKTAQPSIDVGSEQADAGPVYFVRDNGTGFDMAFAGRLFGVFQRLHAADQYPGTGAGLAIVKRIVERHGGRVWAESAPGAGATFRFTLGKTAAEN
ncbi:MAG: ATP-binding protein [Ignavibacteria bacterium]